VAESALARLPIVAKIALGAGLLAVAAIAYFVVFYGDLAAKITTEQGQEQNLRNELAEARRAESAYHKDLAELTDRQQRQRELNKILPAATEYPAFLSAVQSVANATGVNLTAWTPQDEVIDKFYARVPMRLEFQGRYHQVARFFYNVGQLDRIINMENISMTEPKKAADEVMVKVEALATAFRALDETGGSQDKRAQKIGQPQ
jgi:type IV pilus assembly protein PilO